MGEPAALVQGEEAQAWLLRLGVQAPQGLVAEALTHASVGSPHYERLEYLGDAVLKLESSRWLYAQRPALSEGAMTKARAWLVSDVTLSEVAQALGLPPLLRVATPELRRQASVQASALEALMGALWLLEGPASTQAATEAWLGPWLARCQLASAQANPKEALQEWTQGKGQGLPQYRTEAMPTGGFHAQVQVGAAIVGEGQGGTKKAAEQAAAKAALATKGSWAPASRRKR